MIYERRFLDELKENVRTKNYGLNELRYVTSASSSMKVCVYHYLKLCLSWLFSEILSSQVFILENTPLYNVCSNCELLALANL